MRQYGEVRRTSRSVSLLPTHPGNLYPHQIFFLNYYYYFLSCLMFDSDVNYWSKSIPSMFYLSRYLWDIYRVCVWPHSEGLYLWRNRDFRAETKQELATEVDSRDQVPWHLIWCAVLTFLLFHRYLSSFFAYRATTSFYFASISLSSFKKKVEHLFELFRLLLLSLSTSHPSVPFYTRPHASVRHCPLNDDI